MKFGSVKISLELCIFNFFFIFCLLISCSLLHLKTVTNFDNQLIIDPLLSSLSHLSQFICFLVHFLLIVLYPSFTICLDFGDWKMMIIRPFSDPYFCAIIWKECFLHITSSSLSHFPAFLRYYMCLFFLIYNNFILGTYFHFQKSVNCIYYILKGLISI